KIQLLFELCKIKTGNSEFFYRGSKETDTIHAEVFWKNNSYQIQLKEGDGRFVVVHEKLGYDSGRFVAYNDIANYTNEAGIKQYAGLKRGDYIKHYLTEIKKYHFHDTGKPLRSPKKAIYRMTNIICMRKGIIWLPFYMASTRRLQ
ncbi:MAG: hypothetical protein LUE99_02015, partial [Bacteroides sp.]|nr:hypothetical protein [Bacteroides sp.]